VLLNQFKLKDGHWDKPLNRQHDSTSTIIFVFYPPDFDIEKNLSEIISVWPKSHIVGCSGAGEISGEQIFDDRVIVTVAKMERSIVKSWAYTLADSAQSFEIGKKIANSTHSSDLKALYIISTGLDVNASELMRGLKTKDFSKINVSGGLAGDGTNFKKTTVVHNGSVSDRYIAAVGFYGESIVAESNAKGGWLPFGKERIVTKSGGNVLFMLDDKPALALYKDFLGENSKKLPSSALFFPLYLESSKDSVRNAVRTVLSVDESNNSMTFAGDIPQGQSVRFMRSTETSLINAAIECSNNCLDKIDQSQPTLSLMVSCVGRRIVLGTSTECEIQETFKVLPKDSQQTGFYSYGELSMGDSGFCDLHNQTVTLTWIQEKEEK
jgi:hypothetical protein